MATEIIELLSSREIAKMRSAGELAYELLNYLEPMVKPGVNTLTLNECRRALDAKAWS